MLFQANNFLALCAHLFQNIGYAGFWLKHKPRFQNRFNEGGVNCFRRF